MMVIVPLSYARPPSIVTFLIEERIEEHGVNVELSGLRGRMHASWFTLHVRMAVQGGRRVDGWQQYQPQIVCAAATRRRS